MVLNASYVCLLHSHFIENHSIWILKDRPLISELVLSQGARTSLIIYLQSWSESMALAPLIS
jgi:hypothetical protein